MRSKVLLAVTLLLALLLAVQYWLSRQIFVNSLLELEEQAAQVNLDRVQGAIDADLRHLAAMTVDWAAWDDTHAFVLDRNPKYIETNLVEEVFVHSSLDLLLIIDAAGRLVWGNAYDQRRARYSPIPAPLLDLATGSGPLTRLTAPADAVRGLVVTDSGTMLVAAHAVTTSEGDGPVRGALIMGRYLKPDELGARTHLRVAIVTTATHLNGAVPTDRSWIERIDSRQLAAYTSLDDLTGRRLLLRVEMDREVLASGSQWVSILNGINLAFAVALILAVMLLLERLVLKRISRLGRYVEALGNDPEQAPPLHLDGRDELSGFAAALELSVRRLAEAQRALRTANERLEREKAEQQALIGRLEETQDQLLQSEKMASIGQLAAGVAHEINNPVGYIASNLHTLEDYTGGLLRLLEAYTEAEDTLDETRRARLTRLKSEVEIDYVREDLLALLHESQEGTQRVKQIVQDLKDFSHVDDAEWQWADLCKGLDSTLNVVRNELKYKAEVIREYGELPPVRCLPAQLNQVFMNLLVNAAQAIPEKGTITVQTGTHGEWAWVEVADTGVGISQEHLSRLFEPFFTTKPVGKGTGLGLSVSYGIVSRHGGRLEVQSEPGQGARFRVWVPIDGPEEKPAQAASA